jgi:glutaminase
MPFSLFYGHIMPISKPFSLILILHAVWQAILFILDIMPISKPFPLILIFHAV